MNTTPSPELEVFKQMKEFDTSKPVILKAHRYLTDGKVKVISAESIRVLGTEEYTVNKVHGQWICSCPSRMPVCAHVVAASLICDAEFEEPRAEKVIPLRPGVFSGKAK